MAPPLLVVDQLSVVFEASEGRPTTAVDGVSFALQPGEILGIVGESGCGKSVTSLAIMGLIPREISRISGSVVFAGREILAAGETALRDLRGDRLAMIFQEPMTSLNPSLTIGAQISEVLVRHRGASKKDAYAHAVEMLRRVGISEPAMRVHDYPHKLSGGMRQRAMIAMALACEPQLLIADEPTTALDVTIQAQILDLLRHLRDETGTAIMFITHDLGVVSDICDNVLVLYAGQIVEQARVGDIFVAPQHPYTVGLLGSIPRLAERKPKLAAIVGTVPDMTALPGGCRFMPRCPFAMAECRALTPQLVQAVAGRSTRCIRAPLESLVA